MILEKNGGRGLLGVLNIVSRARYCPFASVDTAKAHASVRMREQAAVLSCKCLIELAIRETIEKAGCSIRVLNYSFFMTHPNILRKKLWTHAFVHFFRTAPVINSFIPDSLTKLPPLGAQHSCWMSGTLGKVSRIILAFPSGSSQCSCWYSNT